MKQGSRSKGKRKKKSYLSSAACPCLRARRRRRRRAIGDDARRCFRRRALLVFSRGGRHRSGLGDGLPASEKALEVVLLHGPGARRQGRGRREAGGGVLMLLVEHRRVSVSFPRRNAKREKSRLFFALGTRSFSRLKRVRGNKRSSLSLSLARSLKKKERDRASGLERARETRSRNGRR